MVEKSNLPKPVQGVGMIKAESIKQNLKNEASITFVKNPSCYLSWRMWVVMSKCIHDPLLSSINKMNLS